ncbi:bifunctional diguanylate cyclase/phosphodiesterase [Parasulfuritortus cantonensis]|uniref:Bifunctional diguanylate cyclase/phosphodiesterase n=1 Tax=Parasulfuritortus cantonensis TaxID=2528202 RepID=A0A4R1BL55_9PROT|nr:bifunctional diguanylate cyclase/phosphodiesterase [Parasulfuritortus cantonensis]TCJ18155.1 bifunctional diguanylate cyclase/phosphodiesterase [Parasulfuritortus cantonensis]
MSVVTLPQDDLGAGDWLTGLADRGGCVARLTSLLSELPIRDRLPAVLWLDIDRFRQINNSFGYVVGDSVLVELCRRLERSRPPQSTLARVGGDEFVLILPNASGHEAERIAHKLVGAVHQRLSIGTTRMRPSASVGVALGQPDEDANELLERAERAMAEAKREGGGRVSLAADALLPARDGKYLAREELAVEETLHRALEIGGLYLDYQPIVRVTDGVTVAAEALMRCRVDGEILPPGRFIPVAEKTGLISHLGDWCLVTAAEFVSRMQGHGTALKVAVNVSRVQLQNRSFAKSLHGVLAYTGIQPGRIELEITESLFMDPSEVVKGNIRAALAAGFPLAIDDFGTGYSSLACLKDLPAAKLKLDRAFVVDLPVDRRAFGVARAVAGLAADLGMEVVAEGVETAAQLQLLGEAGINEVQGFHIARPMNEGDLIEWLS